MSFPKKLLSVKTFVEQRLNLLVKKRKARVKEYYMCRIFFFVTGDQ